MVVNGAVMLQLRLLKIGGLARMCRLGRETLNLIDIKFGQTLDLVSSLAI